MRNGEALQAHLLHHLYLYSALLSLLSSFYLIVQSPVISSDTVVYVSAAERLLSHGWAAAAEVTTMISFPALIAALSGLSGLSLLSAADLLNAIAHAGGTVAFLHLVRSLGGQGRVLLIAALLVLLSPGYNGFEELALRDPFYWAFMLLGISVLIRYRLTRPILAYTLAVCFIVLAGAFRPEAVAFLIIPLADVSWRWWRRRREAPAVPLKAAAVLGFMILLLLVVPWALGAGEWLAAFLSHVGRYFDPERIFVLRSESFQAMLPPFYPEEFVSLGLALALLPAMLDSIVGAFSWPIVLILLICWSYRCFSFPGDSVYRGASFVALAVPGVFLLLAGFMTSRYCVLFALLVMAALPASIDRTLREMQSPRWRRGLVGFLLLVLVLDSFVSFGHSRDFIAEGVEWTRDNTSSSSPAVSNRRYITYMLGRHNNYEEAQRIFSQWQSGCVGEWLADYDYFLFYRRDGDEAWVDKCLPQAQLIKRFSNEAAGDTLLIYRL